MNEKNRFHVELPENLRRKFKSLERKLWFVDTLIAVCGIACGLVAFYLLVFMSDRFWDTPALLRMAFTITGGAIAVYYAWFWVKHWVVNRRDSRVLAAIVQRKHRRMGDRLMSAVELTSHDQRAEEVSEELCRAAIEQVDRESEQISFNKAVSTRKSKIAFALAVLILGVLCLPLQYTPGASQSALKRAVPGTGADRYTFVQDGDLLVNGRPAEQGTFYVPRGEPMEFISKYQFADQKNGTPFWETLGGWWQDAYSSAEKMDNNLQSIGTDFAGAFSAVMPDPREAVLNNGGNVEQATMKDGQVKYTLTAGTKPMELALRVGDKRREARIQPVARPILKSLGITLEYPSYLKYPVPEQMDIRGGVFSYLEGSSATFRAGASRGLASGQVKTTGAISSKVVAHDCMAKDQVLTSPKLELDDFSEIELSWVDRYHIAGADTRKLEFAPHMDLPPRAHIVVRKKNKDKVEARVVGMLRHESLSIPALGEDDYGMKELKVYWECFKRTDADQTETTPVPIAKGEVVLVENAPPGIGNRAPGSLSSMKDLSQTWHFRPTDKTLSPQFPDGLPDDTVVNVYAVAKDYFRTDRSVRSAEPVTIYILTPEEHAQLVQSEYDAKMAELDDLVRRQENLHQRTKELQNMDAKELSEKNNDKELAEQEQEQGEIAEKLEEIAKDIGELGKEAAKNKEMDPKTLAEMAKTQQEMKNLAQGEMSEAQQSLSQAQQQQSPQDKQKELDEAEKKEREALDKLKEMQQDAAETSQDMYENTLVLRLRKLAEAEEKIGKDLTAKLDQLIGEDFGNLGDQLQRNLNLKADDQHRNANKANELQGEIKRFAESTKKENFGEVAGEMENTRPPEKLDENANTLRLNQTLKAIGGAQKLGKDFKRWADKLDPAQDGGGGEGEGGQGDDPNEEMLKRLKELLRLRQAEMDLREQTGELEGDRAIRAAKRFAEDARNLAFRQFELLRDLQLEMDARTNLGKGEFLDLARQDMGRAADELDKPETGRKATDAETDAINKLEQEIAALMKKCQAGQASGQMSPEQMEMMMMLMQMMGAQPGQKPGPGQGNQPGMSTAGGNTNKPNQATPGNVQGGNNPDREVRKVAGRADTMPKEYQGALQGFFKGVEKLRK